MNIKELANLINEHALYCQNEYQPHKLKHLSTEDALAFVLDDRAAADLRHGLAAERDGEIFGAVEREIAVKRHGEEPQIGVGKRLLWR